MESTPTLDSTHSPVRSSSIDISTPVTSRRYRDYQFETCTRTTSTFVTNEESSSSPFLLTVNEENQAEAPITPVLVQENVPLAKFRPTSRIMMGAELSPPKILSERSEAENNRSDHGDSIAKAPKLGHARVKSQSPRKMSEPDTGFSLLPAIDGTPGAQTAPRALSLEEAIQENSSLKHAIEIFEDDENVASNKSMKDSVDAMDHEGPSPCPEQTPHYAGPHQAGYDKPENALSMVVDDEERDEVADTMDDDTVGVDDTIASTFSTFSAVPSTTMFARVGNSPSKTSSFGGLTPRAPLLCNRGGPSPLTTPRASVLNRTTRAEGDTTNLLEFNEQVNCSRLDAAHSPNKRGRITPCKPGVCTTSTPRRRVSNLIDFDLPPMPTPRSIPTITPRELESLKSGFLSEISGLRASLSGKEAEASSLKTAVADAEKRVGECMEELRSLRGERESLSAEKTGWERRGREMEKVLRDVKEEIVRGRREREELEYKFHESEQRREAAEVMAQEAESKLAGMKAGQASAEEHDKRSGSAVASPDPVPVRGGAKDDKDRTAQEVEMAVERVARDLHALYKSKHETKVAALKKSYENRWEKRVRELEAKIESLGNENEELRVGRNGTMTRIDVDKLEKLERWEREVEERKERHAKDQAEIKHWVAEVRRLEAVVGETKRDNEEIRGLLERERVEKGELVILAEEMMSMQQSLVVYTESGEEEEHEQAQVQTCEQQDQQQQQQYSATATPGASGVAATRKMPAAESAKAVYGLAGARQSLAMATPASARITKVSGSGMPGNGGVAGAAAARVSGLKFPGSGAAGTSSAIASSYVVSRTGGKGAFSKPSHGVGSGAHLRSGIVSSIEKMGR